MSWSDNTDFGMGERKERYWNNKTHSIDNTTSTHRTKIRTLLWNIEGLRNATNILPDNFFQTYDIVCLIETMLTKDWTTNDLYTIHSLATQGHAGRPKGGITCLLKPRLSPFQVIHKTENILAIQTSLCSIVCAYFQPEWKPYDIIEEINLALTQVDKNEPLILAGDFNSRIDIISEKTSIIISHLEAEGISLLSKGSEKPTLDQMDAAPLIFTSVT